MSSIPFIDSPFVDGFSMEEAPLRVSFEKAYSGPGCIPVQPGLRRCAVTALGVHCLFVQAGFVPQETEAPKTQPVRDLLALLFRLPNGERNFRPPNYWLALLPSPEFMFRYTFPGKCGTFVCHCSLKPETEQMFVHATEEGNGDNIQFVGLLVGYTVPDTEKDHLKQRDSWEGVFGDLDLLTYNVETYLVEPLLRKALDNREFSGRIEDGKITWNLGNGWIKYGALLFLLGCITTTLLKKKLQN